MFYRRYAPLINRFKLKVFSPSARRSCTLRFLSSASSENVKTACLLGKRGNSVTVNNQVIVKGFNFSSGKCHNPTLYS